MAATRLIIFDLDGVITSESGYWNIARRGVRAIVGDAAAAEIPQDFIYWVKNHAVNHNWDLAFVALSALQSGGFAAFRERNEQRTGKDLLAACEGYRAKPWIRCHEVCQQMQDASRPPVEVLLDARPMLAALRDSHIFAVATGRPRAEALAPLRSADILHYFDESRIVTHDDVVEAERLHPGQSFGKPNPFILERAMSDIPAAETVFIGDTLSDAQAASRAGVPCIGVLTALPPGEYREARRATLRAAGCATIVDSVLELPEVLLRKP